jgi:hypothetical protein
LIADVVPATRLSPKNPYRVPFFFVTFHSIKRSSGQTDWCPAADMSYAENSIIELKTAEL